MHRRLVILCAASLLVLHGGCATKQPEGPQPLSPRQLNEFLGRAQDPRRFWLTEYASDDGPVFTGGHRLHTDKLALTPFSAFRLPDMPVLRIRGRQPTEYLAVLDTSSRASWIEYDTALELGLIPLGPPPYPLIPSHTDDAIPGYLSVANKIRIEEMHMDTALLYTRLATGRLTPLLRGEERMRIPILFGCEFIRAFHFVQIDYPNRIMRFSSTIPYTPNPTRLIMTLPLYEIERIFVVEGAMDGQPTMFFLDTIGDYHLALNQDRIGPVAQVSLGDLVFRRVETVTSASQKLAESEIPRVGRRLLSRFVITIDNRNRLIHFERP